MRHPDDFDDFHRATRDRLLLQTFALTGDLATARVAVEAAYAEAWQHRRRLARHPDPESWVRVRARRKALRRRPTRFRHDRGWDERTRATLDALDALTPAQRRVLVLAHLTSLGPAELAREAALTPDAAWLALREGTAAYAARRDLPPTRIPLELAALGEVARGQGFRRAAVLRHAGNRRGHRVTGLAAAAVALVAVSASAVTMLGDGAVTPDDPVSPASGEADTAATPVPPTLERGDLLGERQVARLSPPGRWRAPRTSADEGVMPTVCQTAPFADPDPMETLVREFRTVRRPRVAAVQVAELSQTRRAARSAYAATMAWYADCAAPRTQLVSFHRLDGVGEEAAVLVLRRWGEGAGSIAVAVARTGRVVTSALRLSPDPAPPAVRPLAGVLAAAVDSLCGGVGADACTRKPVLRRVPPPPIAPEPGLLDDLDLPRAGSVTAGWRGTEPAPASPDAIVIACDDSDFSAPPVRRGRTRTFLIIGEDLPASFGITENAGSLDSAGEAQAFVDDVRGRLAGCEDEDPASTVSPLFDRSGGGLERRLGTGGEVAGWRVRTEVSDSRSVEVVMAVVRRGRAVAQLGLVPAEGARIDTQDFLALAERAAERLRYLEGPGSETASRSKKP